MPALLVGMLPWESQLRVHFQATSFIAENQEMLWRTETDVMVRRQASGQGARKIQSFEFTDLSCRILLDWHCSDGKYLSMSVEEQYHFWTKSSLPGWSCHLTFCAPLSRVAGPGQGALVGQHGGLWHGLLSKGYLVPSAETLGDHSRKLG